MQTTLLGLAIAVILAIVAALVAPLVVDWNHYRSAFENEASRLTGLSVRVQGAIDARILPTPRIKLRDIEIGAAGRPPQLRAGALDLELRLGPLLRRQLQASEARLVAPRVDLTLDRSGVIDWPAMSPSFHPAELSISRLNVVDGSIALTDAASGSHLKLQNLSFDGDIRSLLGPFKGDGAFVVGDESFRYRISGSRPDGDNGLKIRLGVDPADHPLTIAFDGALTLDRGVPQFDGTLALARPVGAALASGQRVMSDPWHAGAAIRLTPASAALQDVVFQYGPDERAINFTGKAELSFGGRPHFDGEVAALEVNVDRALAAPDLTHRPPLLVVKSFVEAFVAAPKLPMPGRIGVGIAGLTVGGTTIQSLHGGVRFDDTGWSLENFEFRAPGVTQVSLSGQLKATAHGLAFNGPGALESTDADMLLAWLGGHGLNEHGLNEHGLNGHGDVPSAAARALHAHGDITIAGERLAVDRLTATLDRENVGGRFAYTWPAADRAAVVEADLHATKLDLDALAAFATTAVDKDGLALPRQGTLALDIGKATLAGVDAQGLSARIKFDAGALQIERLLIAELGGTALAINGRIDELSSQPRGRVSIELSAGALTGLAGVIAKYAPRTADLFRRAADRLAPAKMHGSLTVERAATTGSSAKLALNGQLGLLRIALNGEASGEPSRLDAANLRIDSRLDADDATTLTALFGLDRIIGVDQLPGDVTLSATGPLNGELRIDGAAAASGLTAAVRGAVRLSGPAARSGQFQVLATVADVRPLQQAMTGQPGSPVAISARSAVAVTGEAVSLSQIAIAAGKASVRGQLAVNLSSPIEINGDLAADNVDGAWLTAMVLGLPAKAPGAAGLWSGQPFGAGAFTAMNGAVAFSFDRAAFTPALFASNLKGVAQFRPTEITLKNLTGNLAGGGVSGELAFRRNADGLVGHGHIALADADAATILGADKKTIDARLTLNSDIDSLGANPAALVRALHGGGAVTLTDAHIAGLDTRAFVAAMRAADQGPTIEPAKIQPAVNAALTAGRLVVPQGDAVLTITDGKASVANVTLPAQDGAALALAGTLDLNTASLDTRMTLSGAPPAHALIRVRPELSVTLKGPLAAPARTLDISALTGWLTLRAAELQTRRLESIEANGRSDAVGRSFRPDVPVVRMAPAGEIVESERLANVAAPTAAARGLDLLQPEVPAAAATGSTTSARPRAAPQPPLPKPPPPPPNAAGPALSAPLDLLFRPQN